MADAQNNTEAKPPVIASVGHLVFAATMVTLGIVGLVQGDFTPTWSGVPKSVPAREGIAYLCAVISLVCGVGLLLRRTIVIAAGALLAYFVIWFLLFRVSHIFRAPTALVSWWASADTAVMTAGAWVLYARVSDDSDGQWLRFASGDKGVGIARVLFGLGLIPFGAAHFINLKGTATLVPSWLPWPVGWSYLTGFAFITAGVAVLIGVCARLAATLTTLQLAVFTLVIWVPVVITGPNAFQWSEFLDSLALMAAAWVVADSYRGMPWFAVGQR